MTVLIGSLFAVLIGIVLAQIFRPDAGRSCPRGGRHVVEIGHGGDYCIKCGKVNP